MKKHLLVIVMMTLALVCLVGFASNRLDDLEVTGASILRGTTTLYNGIFQGSFTGDLDLNSYLDIDSTNDTYYAANIKTTGTGGALFVDSTSTGNIFAFAHDGTTQFSMADGGGFVFADASKPVKRIILPLDVGGGTATIETFQSCPSINLDATDETFFAAVPIPADWDGASDLTIYMMVGNEIAETDGDDVSITFTVKGYGDGETMATAGQTCALLQDLTGGDQAIDIVNTCTATIDYNEASHPIAVDDVMTIKGFVNLTEGTECTGPLHIVAWWIEYTADQLTQ